MNDEYKNFKDYDESLEPEPFWPIIKLLIGIIIWAIAALIILIWSVV